MWLVDGILELDANPSWLETSSIVLIKKGVTVGALRSAVRASGNRRSREDDDLVQLGSSNDLGYGYSGPHHEHEMSREGGLPTTPAASRSSSLEDAPGRTQCHHCGLVKGLNKKASHR